MHKLYLTLSVSCLALLIFCAGCSTNTTVEQDREQYKKGVLLDTDPSSVIAGKVIARTLLGVLTLGTSELSVDALKNRIALYNYYDSFVGLPRSHVLRMNGAPTDTSSDGNGGTLIAYRLNKFIGNRDSASSYNRTLTFFFDKDDLNTGWHLRIE